MFVWIYFCPITPATLFLELETEPVMLSKQDIEVLKVLEELENTANANFTGCERKYNTDDSKIKGQVRQVC